MARTDPTGAGSDVVLGGGGVATGDLERHRLWRGVGRLIDRAPSLDGLVAHGLHLLAARHWRECGREVPSSLTRTELVARVEATGAREILQSARDAYDGRLLVLKGPEIAARYPGRALRPSTDIDLLAEDAEEAQRALLAAGFRPVGPYADDYYEGLQHLRPLQLPGKLGPVVEIHRRPNWVTWGDPPSTTELLAAAVPGRTGVQGVLAPSCEHHALMVAAHSWAELPLRRILDLVDVLALTAEADRVRADSIARAWKLDRLWRTTIEVAECLLLDGPSSLPLRTWAMNLLVPRDRTVVENHVRRWVGPFWARPPVRAAGAAVLAVIHDVTPVPGERRASKLMRVREAIAHPARPATEHKRVLGPGGVRVRHKRR